MTARQKLETRFWARAQRNDAGCLVWQGNTSNNHARLHLRKAEQPLFDGKSNVSAHLIAWRLTHGTFEKFVDRTCGNSLCVAPEHLEKRTKESRFWRKVDRETTPKGCWPWVGGKHSFGYGSTVDGSSHRVAYELVNGPVPKGKVVRHMCHNPSCCRPDHLSIGTQYDNVHDAIAAGRMNYAKGERISKAKLTNKQAKALREVYLDVCRDRKQGDAFALLATLLEVTPPVIRRIVQGKSYGKNKVEIDQICLQLRKDGFPWETLKDTTKDPLGSVRRSKVVVEEGTIRTVGFAGQRTCLAAHPQMLKASHKDQLSVVGAFNDDEFLARAVQYQLGRNDPTTPAAVVRALRALLRAPRNFPPALTRWLVDEYLPPAGVVFDPCSGFGGRLLGTIASIKGAFYIGHDVEPAAVEGNLKLAELAPNRVLQRNQSVENSRAWPSADLVMTSPPYYDLEAHGPVAQTMLARYGSYDAWRDGFLRALIDKALAAAPTVIINVKANKKPYPLYRDVKKLAGNAVDHVLSWPLRAFGKRRGEEKLIVLRR